MKNDDLAEQERIEREKTYDRLRMYAAILLAAATTFSFFFKLVFF